MSFELICPGCGAISGPSVGVCPFCKTILTSPHEKNSEQKSSINKIYESGRLDLALELAKKFYQTEEAKKDFGFLLMYAKILIDTEGPTSHIKSNLMEAYLLSPNNQEVLDYIELIEAKRNLKKGLHDSGEIQIKNLLRRSPHNVHAHFIIGTHLFWTDEQPEMAIPYLETCVRLSPNFLRAWGCLGVIYQKLGNQQLAARAFQRCAELEPNIKMREYFEHQIKNLK